MLKNIILLYILVNKVSSENTILWEIRGQYSNKYISGSDGAYLQSTYQIIGEIKGCQNETWDQVSSPMLHVQQDLIHKYSFRYNWHPMEDKYYQEWKTIKIVSSNVTSSSWRSTCLSPTFAAPKSRSSMSKGKYHQSYGFLNLFKSSGMSYASISSTACIILCLSFSNLSMLYPFNTSLKCSTSGKSPGGKWNSFWTCSIHQHFLLQESQQLDVDMS